MSELIAKQELHRPALPPDAERWLDSLPIAMLGVDAGERVRLINARAAEMLASAGRGLVGRLLSDIFAKDAPIVALAHRALTRSQTVHEADVVIEGPGFNLGAADLWAASLEGGRFAAIAITPRPRQRVGAEARPVSVVARTLAHEVRNPLAGIRAAAQLIPKSSTEEVRQLAELICDEVDRIRRLTDRIGALEGLAPPRFAEINVHEALERVRRIIASTFTDVKIRERYDPSLPHVRADFDQLIQAFLNIAKNGAEAARASGGGEITLATAYRPGVRIRSSLGGAPRAQLEVSIEDNGPGIPKSAQSRLFEPFVTTKSGGMGLGLAVSAEIVARHDGRIEAESAPGRTIFRLLLPIEPPENGT